MMNESIITTGSVFLSGAFASLLYPQKQEEISIEELESKVESAKVLLGSTGTINAPLIIEKLNCDSKTANKIIGILIDRGFIIPVKE